MILYVYIRQNYTNKKHVDLPIDTFPTKPTLVGGGGCNAAIMASAFGIYTHIIKYTSIYTYKSEIENTINMDIKKHMFDQTCPTSLTLISRFLAR